MGGVCVVAGKSNTRGHRIRARGGAQRMPTEFFFFLSPSEVLLSQSLPPALCAALGTRFTGREHIIHMMWFGGRRGGARVGAPRPCAARQRTCSRRYVRVPRWQGNARGARPERRICAAFRCTPSARVCLAPVARQPARAAPRSAGGQGAPFRWCISVVHQGARSVGTVRSAAPEASSRVAAAIGGVSVALCPSGDACDPRQKNWKVAVGLPRRRALLVRADLAGTGPRRPFYTFQRCGSVWRCCRCRATERR